MIGILGISGNPPHRGHNALILHLINNGIFDTLILILTGNRNDKKYVHPDHRVNMCELTFGRIREQELTFNLKTEFIIRYSNIYSSNTPTILLLRRLKEEFRQDKLKFIIGSDLIFQKNGKCEIESSWYAGKQLMKEFDFLVIQREQYPINRKLPSNFEIYDKIFTNISSSEIRKNVKENIKIEGLVTPNVEKYIKKHNLYKQ